jgi:hypothetical protein
MMNNLLIDKVVAAASEDLGYAVTHREVESIINNYRTYVKFSVVEVYDFGDTLSESVWRKRQVAKESET